MAGLDNVQLHFIDNIETAYEFKRWLGERREVLAVDTETSGLSWQDDHLRLVQFGDQDTGWAIPWDEWKGVTLDALRTYEGQLAYHNAKFDTHFLRRVGVDTVGQQHRTDDTMVMAHILDPTRSVALKSLTTFHIDPKSAAAQRVLDEAMVKNGWTWATVPTDFPSYWAYGALDTVLTARLWHILRPQVETEAPAAYDLEMARTWVVQRQEINGCHIDRAYTEEKLNAFNVYVDQMTEWCTDAYGVSPGSNPAVIQRLQEDGVVFTKYTKSGSHYALDKEVLEGIDHPLANAVLHRRQIQKLSSTYLGNFLDMADADDLLHPNVRVLGARTGRESVTTPALQTLPRRSESNQAANAVRNCITGRTEEHVLVTCDFSQIEQRLFAHLSEDPGMIGAFAEGDFFVNVARELYADPQLQKDDPRRQLTKNGMYALGYGAGAEKIALTTGTSLESVHEFLSSLGQRFPGLRQFQRKVGSTAKHRLESEGIAYVRSPLTRRKHVADSGKEYALVNYLIQSMAAEIFKMKTIEMAACGLDEYLVLGVHDEVVLDVPTDLADDVSVQVKEIMEDDQLLSVPLAADVARAYRWGDAK